MIKVRISNGFLDLVMPDNEGVQQPIYVGSTSIFKENQEEELNNVIAKCVQYVFENMQITELVEYKITEPKGQELHDNCGFKYNHCFFLNMFKKNMVCSFGSKHNKPTEEEIKGAYRSLKLYFQEHIRDS